MGILMLTTRAEIDDRIRGLDEGADDYVAKPFDLGELLARMRSILRREGAVRHPILQVDDFLLDSNTMKAFFRHVDVGLGLREFALVEYLVRSRGRVISQEELIEHVWGDEIDPFSSIVRVHITRIREKLQALGSDDLITTVKGKGYMISGSQ